MSTKLAGVLVLILTCASLAVASGPYRVNLGHLLSLVQKVKLDGEEVSVVDIYADYPTYRPVVAKGEGFACVDDAARAAVLLIRYNEVFEKHENGAIIDGLLKFLMRMQTKEGYFYNFVKNDAGTIDINKDGRTSVASFGWWAARALWALGEAAEYYKGSDTSRYWKVVSAFDKSMPQVDSLLRNFGKLSSSGGPTWLLYGDGADATSELVFGLDAIYRATGKVTYLNAAGKLCDGMTLLQKGGCSVAPYGMFASNGGGWHGWANSQATAIMQYSRLSSDTAMFSKALAEVDCFLPRWAGARFFRSCSLEGDSLDYSGQIAYDVRPAVSAAVQAYEMTRDDKYKTLACVLASWFFGNNTTATQFYYPRTGLCFDGSIDSLNVNKNSGAESTVEALLTMVELNSIGADFLKVTLIGAPSLNAYEYKYNVSGGVLVMKMIQDGFELDKIPTSR